MVKIYDAYGNLLPIVTSKDTSNTYDRATDALEAIRDRIDALNTADQTDLDQLLVYCDILDHATNGLANIYANIASILVDYLAHGTWGLAAIRTGVADVKTDTYNIHNNVLSAINDYLGHGTWGLAKIRSALQLVQTDADQIDANVLSIINDHLSQMKSSLVRWGQISAVGSATEFTSPQLAGLGVDAMHGWYVYVMQADNAAPEGEYRLMTDYTDAGVVTHNAFSTGLAIGDRVQLIHPVLYHTYAATRGSGTRSLETLGQEQDALLDTARGKYTKTMTGNEDDLYGESSDTEFVLQEFRVDLHNMAVGDTICFRVYTTEDGTERKISEDIANTFIDVQDPTRVEIVGSSNMVWGREDISVTAEQTAGTNREIVCYWRDSKRGS